jgi:hypothetical protein
MPPLLFKGVNKRRWDWTTQSYPWLPPEEFPAAPFSDFRSLGECEDSVWVVENNPSNLSRLVTALAAGRKSPDKFDYVLIDESRVQALSIAIKETQGASADPAANEKWHRDLVELTWRKLASLIHLVHDHGQFTRVSEKDVAKLLWTGMQSGELDQSKMPTTLLEYLRF